MAKSSRGSAPKHHVDERVQLAHEQREYQPAHMVSEQLLLPGHASSVQVSGGQNTPYYYYLGANNTIPFVRFESPDTQKELSWGDVIELPPRVLLNVRNVSYMPGDLQIQSGTWPSPGPKRITVPIRCQVQTVAPGTVLIEPLYPCDTRRAVKAYFAFSLGALVDEMEITVSGYFDQHSQNPDITAVREAYQDSYDLAAPEVDTLPLGTSYEGNGMRLADFAKVQIYATGADDGSEEVPTPAFVDAFYVLEY